jgi:hypothetical protein
MIEAAQMGGLFFTPAAQKRPLFERPRSPTTKGDYCNSRYLVTGWPSVLIFRVNLLLRRANE